MSEKTIHINPTLMNPSKHSKTQKKRLKPAIDSIKLRKEFLEKMKKKRDEQQVKEPHVKESSTVSKQNEFTDSLNLFNSLSLKERKKNDLAVSASIPSSTSTSSLKPNLAFMPLSPSVSSVSSGDISKDLVQSSEDLSKPSADLSRTSKDLSQSSEEGHEIIVKIKKRKFRKVIKKSDHFNRQLIDKTR